MRFSVNCPLPCLASSHGRFSTTSMPSPPHDCSWLWRAIMYSCPMRYSSTDSGMQMRYSLVSTIVFCVYVMLAGGLASISGGILIDDKRARVAGGGRSDFCERGRRFFL